MKNSVDPDQMACKEAIWSGSTLFLKGNAYPGSAEQGLIMFKITGHLVKAGHLDNSCNSAALTYNS